MFLKNSGQILRFLLLCGSCLLWLFIFKDFIVGAIPINSDTNSNFLVLKFFFDNVLQGVLPLWDPFTYLGRHFVYIVSSGALNPFAWSIPILYLFGFDFYQAYICFIVGYFFLGCFGFYEVLFSVLRNRYAASLGYLLLLFSGLGPTVFNQIHLIYIYVPAVWFFVYWIRFFSDYRLSDFWGLILSFMIISISSVPFYFYTVFLSLNCIYPVLFFQNWLVQFLRLREFIVGHRAALFCCVIAVIISLLPLALFKVMDSRGENIIPERHQCSTSNNAQCPQNAELDYPSTALNGSLGERMPGGRIFSHLDKFSYHSDDFIYIPVVCYFILAVSAFAFMDRLRLMVLLWWFLIFLTALGALTPVHRFLFEHIFYFQYFRNLFFFSAFLIPLAVFFSAAQFQVMFDKFSDGIRIPCFWVPIAGLSGLALIFFHGNVLGATYVSLGAAIVLLTILRFDIPVLVRRAILVLLPAVAILEPWQVFASNISHIPKYTCQFPKDEALKVFEYVRPAVDGNDQCLPLYRREIYDVLRSTAAFKDRSGYFKGVPDFLVKYVLDFKGVLGQDRLAAYARYKLLLYGLPDAHFSFERLLEGKDVRVLDAPSQQLKVFAFDSNTLKIASHLDQEKFLVYNDAYTSDWKVYVDGKEEKLHRTNIAFKGVYIPAGEHIVEFRYSPLGGVWVYVLFLGVAFVALYLTVSGDRFRNGRDE